MCFSLTTKQQRCLKTFLIIRSYWNNLDLPYVPFLFENEKNMYYQTRKINISSIQQSYNRLRLPLWYKKLCIIQTELKSTEMKIFAICAFLLLAVTAVLAKPDPLTPKHIKVVY